MIWYAVRTATRQEKRAEASLKELGFEVYLPRLKRLRRDAYGHKHNIEEALFPGYLFIGLEPPERFHAVLAAEGVHAFVRTNGRPQPLDSAADVYVIRAQEAAGQYDRTKRLRPDPEVGAVVVITGGQFQGFPAEFVKRRADERIQVLLSLFGKQTPLVLKPKDVRGFDVGDEDVAA